MNRGGTETISAVGTGKQKVQRALIEPNEENMKLKR